MRVGVRVSGELVLDDAQARGLLQVDDALHDRVPLDGLQVGVADVQLVLEEGVHLEQRAQVTDEVRDRPAHVGGEEQHIQREEEARPRLGLGLGLGLGIGLRIGLGIGLGLGLG